MALTDTQTEHIDIPYPDAEPLALEIAMGASGDVRVGGGAAGAFVSGAVEYNVAEWKPRVEQRGGSVRVVQSPSVDNVGLDFTNTVNNWDLRLGNAKPFSLRIRVGANKGRWDLGGLPLTELRIETGASQNDFTFDAPNPETMTRLELLVGAAAVELDGLLNAGLQRMDVKGGAGHVALRFTGEALRHDARVRIEGGVGHFAIVVDENVPARVKSTGLSAVVAEGGFERASGLPFISGTFVNPAYQAAAGGPRLEFDVVIGVGAVTLDSR